MNRMCQVRMVDLPYCMVWITGSNKYAAVLNNWNLYIHLQVKTIRGTPAAPWLMETSTFDWPQAEPGIFVAICMQKSFLFLICQNLHFQEWLGYVVFISTLDHYIYFEWCTMIILCFKFIFFMLSCSDRFFSVLIYAWFVIVMNLCFLPPHG